MEIACVLPKNTNTVTTRKLRINLSWKLCRTVNTKMVTTRNLEINLSWKLFVPCRKTQTRGSQEPKKSSLAHSLLQAVILVQSGQVTKIWHGAKNLSERCLIHLICVLFTVNREIP